MMMAKEDEGSSGVMDDLFSSADDERNDVLIDLESFLRVLEEPTEPPQGNMLNNLPIIDARQGLQNSNEILSLCAELPGFGVVSPSHNSEVSDCRTGCSDGLSESAGTSLVAEGERLDSSQFGVAEHSCSRSATDCISAQGNGLPYTHRFGGSWIPSSYCQNNSEKGSSQMPNHTDTLSSYSAYHVIPDGESLEIYHQNHEEDLSGCSVVDPFVENLYRKKSIGNTNFDTHAAHVEDISIIDTDKASQGASHIDAGPYNLPYFSHTSGFNSFACDGGRTVNIIDEGRNPNEDFISMMPCEDLLGDELAHCIAKSGSGSKISLNGQVGVTKCNDMLAMENELKKLSSNHLSNVFSKIRDDIKFESIKSDEIVLRASAVIDDVISRKCYGGAGKLPVTEGVQWSPSNSLSSISCNNYITCAKNEKEDMLIESKRAFLSFGMVGAAPIKSLAVGTHDWDPDPVLQVSGQPGILPPPPIKAEINSQGMEIDMTKFSGVPLSNISHQEVWNNTLEQRNLDDDYDLCILEDMSAPARPDPTVLSGKLVADSQFSMSRDPVGQMVMGHSKLKPNNEQVIFRVAMQDLSQPKVEATPPDGVLAVTLLKHQRLALSWMVNQETKGACCSGGILADDQGLGKTVSTIALILKERPPSSKARKANKEQSETEMLNLDEDDGGSYTYQVKEPCEFNGGKTCLQTKGRPAAGTLIVCPTSVLRQWSEELHNKVTSEADLSVLVYHGSNRTKDPLELAKYDVVITTYAIVSMEVPKQPVVDENDDQIGTPFKGLSSAKKRKLLEMSCKKPSTSKKSKKGIDSELLETISGPLAKVGWFRVVLDEAQSIKNHRTQVARACWGLRAKRRWCLSGTPIQNTIDDLYSYFRFLRHEPYAIFRTFCEQLKAPIHRNPKDGYKKLQAVLKTIMLRRTKGTFIDGEPIINLPPKTIELRKVDFSEEEREFYCRLEADSRAQFAEYAAAGTVKQNYVNILLMLLRLRQACDHPLLVKGFNSSSQMTSSIDMAKKLPQEKLTFLLSCLEASLAICGICSDPPEDAVVTVCGHVFCNQCIYEHMIGDDIQCPTKNCKTHLAMLHVFSITTLRLAMSDQQSVENTPNCSDSKLAKVSESCSLSCPQGSSKIKAALDLLLSLSKPENPTLRMSSTESIEGYCGSEILHGCDLGRENGTSDMKRDSNNSSVKVMGEKAIVFSQWTRMLDLLEAFLKTSSIQYRRLDGTMPVAARDKAVKDFNSLPQVSVMIMSLKAASLGLNMVAACNVILLDLWWNPTTEDQAIDRAHRIGQTRPVSVFRLTVKDTVEDRILALQQKKREMVASAFGEDGTGSRQSRLTVDDLEYLFRAD